ncbi:MAG: alpha/beta hydrolase [Cellulophaga sp.]
MQKLKKIVSYLFLFSALLTIMLYLFQEKLIFLPTKLPQEYTYSFSQDFSEFNLNTEDGATLNALHFKQENPKGVLLYFHGNAGDLSRWGEITTFFVEKQYDVIVMDYRTYGKSTGELSEKLLHKDAQLFYEYTLKHYSESEISIYGRSLGTGIATKLASDNNPKQLILETPFSSLIDVAKERFPFLPINWLLKYKLKSEEYIERISCPITIFHGTEDSVVSYDLGLRLYNAIPGENKKMYTIEKGNHNNLIQFDTYRNGIDAILK